MVETAELQTLARRMFARLLRVQRKTFARDTALIKAAWSRTREEFETNRPLIHNEEAFQRKLKEAAEVCELLEHNVIQAELKSAADTTTTPSSAIPTYRLNFRPGIEINDGHVKGKTGKCC